MNTSTDKAMLEEESLPRERDNDSSMQPQYEDSVPADRGWEYEDS